MSIIRTEAGTYEVWQDGNLLRRCVPTESMAWHILDKYNAGELQAYYWPSNVLAGDDYVHERRMKRIYATSKENALDWIQNRYGGLSLTIDNVFQYQGDK